MSGWSVTGRLLGLARPAAPMLVLSTVSRVLGLAAGAALLVVPARAVARLASTGHVDVPGVLLTMAAVAVLGGLLHYVEQYAGHHVAFTLLTRMRVDLYRALVPQAPAVAHLDRSGRLLGVATHDVDHVEVFFAHTIAPVTTAVVVPVVGVVVAGAVAGGRAAAVLGVGLLVGLLSAALLGRRSGWRLAEQEVVARGALTQQVTDDVHGHAELLAFDAVGRRVDLLDDAGRRLARIGRRLGRREAARATVGLWWVWATMAATVALVGRQVVDGGVPVVAWATVVMLAPGLAPAVAGVEGFARSLPVCMAAAGQYLEVKDRPPAVASPGRPDKLRLDPVHGDLRLEGVTFTYPGRTRPAVSDVDLHVAPGERVGIVGPTGSGKSTLVALLQRVWDPQAGTVRLDGVDVRTLELEQVFAAVSVVDQRPTLFDGTVRDNLLVAAPDASPTELADVCRLVRLAPDPALPDGLDTRIGERAARLSGGQRQRLSLARALLRASPVLVLDEATSQQDPLTQQVIASALATRPGVTVLVVAHRRAVLEGVDRVYQVDDGRVVAGPPRQRLRPGA